MRTGRNGFTLLEVILGLILAGLLAMLVSTYLSRGITSPDEPILRVQRAATLANGMEAVLRDYAGMSTHTAADMTSFAARVGNFQANYGAYCADCTGSVATITLGGLSNAQLVTITNGSGQSLSHVFTVQDY